MTHRRLRQFAVGVLAIATPLTASAQVSGSVTVGPLAVGAPALGWPALGALTIALALGAVVLPRRSSQPAARLLGVVALVLTAAVGHAAVANVIITADECRQVTQETYPALPNVELQSQCPNA